MIETVDEKWDRSANLLFKDDGPVKPGARTRLFTITSRHTGAPLGIVRWHAPWRQYVGMPLNAIFDWRCFQELSEFCRTKTLEQRAKSKK
jgi:hypothetical protein